MMDGNAKITLSSYLQINLLNVNFPRGTFGKKADINKGPAKIKIIFPMLLHVTSQ